MARINFSDEEVIVLRKQRFLHPDPKVQIRLEALLLKSKGLKHAEIIHILEISDSALSRWVRIYRRGGLDELTRLGYGKTTSELANHRQTLLAYFQEHPPATIKEAAKRIEEITGIRRGLTQVRKFLSSMGFKLRKTGAVPRGADPEQQENFKKKSWSRS
jgi:transposase